MAFEDSAAQPKSRKFLYWGLALLAVTLGLGPVAQMTVVHSFSPGVAAFGVVSWIMCLWFLLRHFRGADRGFSKRERGYWLSFILPTPLIFPLVYYAWRSSRALGAFSNGGGARVSPLDVFNQPTSPLLAVLIATGIVGATLWSVISNIRNCDEQEERAHLWAGTLGFLTILTGAPAWHFLALGGVLPALNFWVLLALSYIVLSVTWTKLKFF